MPVLPLVGSTIVAPGLSTPRRSASSSIATAMRSLTLPPGLSDSSFATTVVPLARAPAAPALRLERRAGALDGAKDVADGDLLGRMREMVAAGRSPLGREELRALQREQDLLEVPLGNRLARRDLLNGREPVLPVDGQVEHRLDRVLALRRDSHGLAQPAGFDHRVRPAVPSTAQLTLPPPRSRTRAASLAKYVITTSAPARRIDVSASIIARSSSSQPRRPAARTIAYSTETE